jgi:hypothetical protein
VSRDDLGSTAAKSAANRGWRHERVTEPDPSTWWVFSDGSSNGSYGAVTLVVHDGRFVGLIGRTRKGARTESRNVRAEVLGVALGISRIPVGSRVRVVIDYDGTAAWLAGQWRIKKTDVFMALKALIRVVEERRLSLSFIHHRGHQQDGSGFSVLNGLADWLAGRGKKATVKVAINGMGWSEVAREAKRGT